MSKGIPKEQLDMPKKPFVIMGALDSLASIMQVFASTYLTGPLIILLSQVIMNFLITNIVSIYTID